MMIGKEAIVCVVFYEIIDEVRRAGAITSTVIKVVERRSVE